MQLGLTPDVLFPLGAGAVIVAVIIGLVVALRRGRRIRAEETSDPVAADWTGEAATGAADLGPASGAPQSGVPTALRVTVAQAVAVRDADTAPLPVSSQSFLSRPDQDASVPARAEIGDASTPDDAAPAAGTSPTVDEGQAAQVPAAQLPAVPAQPGAVELPAVAVHDVEALDGAGPATDPAASDTGPAASDPGVPAVSPRPSGGPAGSARPVAAAVAQALAARATASRRAEPDPSAPQQAPPESPSRRGDARDRLLAVLLDDPARAVGAAVELETCRNQLDRLADAMRHERGVLGDVVGRLSAAGLRPDQLARLSGLPVDEVRELLEAPVSRT